MAVVGPAIFGAAVGERALQGDGVLLVERDHPVVEQVGGGERGLAVPRVAASPRPTTGSEFGEANLGVGVDEGLLVDAPVALQRPDVKGVLTRRSIPGIRRRIRRAPPLSALAFSRAATCASVRIRPS